MADDAEKKLTQYSYTGENRNWTFEKYSTLNNGKHNIIDSLKEHGYTGIEQRYKVRYLGECIKTTCLESVKTHILSDKILRQFFTGSLLCTMTL